VVEFEYDDKPRQGILFNDDSFGLSIATAHTWFCEPENLDLTLIGHTDKLDGVTDSTKAVDKTGCYFASKPRYEFTPQGSYAERQKQAVKHHGWEVGSKVKVVRGYSKGEEGFRRIWQQGKDDAIGKIFTIIGNDGGAIKISTGISGSEWFPYFVLEPVK
jgi:hypothetical protein